MQLPQKKAGQNEVEIAIAKYGNRPSIIAITEKIEKLSNPAFGFDFTSYDGTVKEINNVKIKKVSQKTDIPFRIIKENVLFLISCIIILKTRCLVLPFSLA